ncbi:MAG TPA: ornithine carbamoyltransferase [Caldisericia bacterium]|nr:ornithine carbamoyltransferase [Caldisericia bacterium]HXK51410.1 ornithine carbamoyltransferase [Caldisericia bacterium]
MPGLYQGRNFVSIHDYTVEDLQRIFDLTKLLKLEEHTNQRKPILNNKTLGMIFEKSSTRTRVSFEIGMNQMGGKAIFLSSKDIQLGRGETIPDTARVLSRYVDGIMARVFSHDTIVQLAEHSSCPVINGLSDFLHPCQAVADFFTMYEKRGYLKGLHLTYIGDSNNVSNSLMMAAAKTGVDITICSPGGFTPCDQIMEWWKMDSPLTGATLTIISDPTEAVAKADFIYTDVWTSMGQEKEEEERRRIFKPYQVNDELLAKASKDVMVLHCLPAHRGDEITDSVMDGPKAAVFDEAENRLHAQKAIMALLMS